MNRYIVLQTSWSRLKQSFQSWLNVMDWAVFHFDKWEWEKTLDKASNQNHEQNNKCSDWT